MYLNSNPIFTPQQMFNMMKLSIRIWDKIENITEQQKKEFKKDNLKNEINNFIKKQKIKKTIKNE